MMGARLWMLILCYLYFGQYLCYKRDFVVNFKIVILTIIGLTVVYHLQMNIFINKVVCNLENTLFIRETLVKFLIFGCVH